MALTAATLSVGYAAYLATRPMVQAQSEELLLLKADLNRALGADDALGGLDLARLHTLARLRGATGQWRSLAAAMVGWGDLWLDAVQRGQVLHMGENMGSGILARVAEASPREYPWAFTQFGILEMGHNAAQLLLQVTEEFMGHLSANGDEWASKLLNQTWELAAQLINASNWIRVNQLEANSGTSSVGMVLGDLQTAWIQYNNGRDAQGGYTLNPKVTPAVRDAMMAGLGLTLKATNADTRYAESLALAIWDMGLQPTSIPHVKRVVELISSEYRNQFAEQISFRGQFITSENMIRLIKGTLAMADLVSAATKTIHPDKIGVLARKRIPELFLGASTQAIPGIQAALAEWNLTKDTPFGSRARLRLMADIHHEGLDEEVANALKVWMVATAAAANPTYLGTKPRAAENPTSGQMVIKDKTAFAANKTKKPETGPTQVKWEPENERVLRLSLVIEAILKGHTKTNTIQ